jgi:hypothetical protein
LLDCRNWDKLWIGCIGVRSFCAAILINSYCRNGKEIEKTVKKIAQDKDSSEADTKQQQPIDLDENELKKYEEK